MIVMCGGTPAPALGSYRLRNSSTSEAASGAGISKALSSAVMSMNIKLHAHMRNTTASPIGDVGRHVPAMSAALRPDPLTELHAWGGERLVNGKRVLDLGCGDGRFALGVAPLASTVDGLDPDPESIAAAKKHARRARATNVRFTVGAAQQLPYPEATFDVVILSWSL